VDEVESAGLGGQDGGGDGTIRLQLTVWEQLL
jgi:hypothetical protein